jgi:hypothetical protein
MTRFFKVFLRDQLDGRMHVAGFGKHPAWDDHIDDIGLETETLVIAKQLLYSQGIATQLASGAWDHIETTDQSIEFDHRFVWARKGQALAGTILASSDGKGRARFPMIVCVQAESSALQAIQLYLTFAESLGRRCKAATSRQAVRESLQRACEELTAFPAVPGPQAKSRHSDFQGDDAIVQILGHLSETLRSTRPGGMRAGTRNSITFRVPAISLQTLENLEFWTGYLELCARLEVPYLAVASIGRSPVDLIVGEPAPNDFFCLRARETVLPLTRAESRSRRTADFETGARVYVESYRLGPGADTTSRRSWWSRLFSKLFA